MSIGLNRYFERIIYRLIWQRFIIKNGRIKLEASGNLGGV